MRGKQNFKFRNGKVTVHKDKAVALTSVGHLDVKNTKNYKSYKNHNNDWESQNLDNFMVTKMENGMGGDT